MPLYEYVCSNCKQEFEALVRGSEVPACPHCGATKLDRLLSVPAAHTKGSEAGPVCRPSPAPGGCGAPWCGTGGCGGP